MRYWIGPWQWKESTDEEPGGYEPPSESVGAIDLGTIPAMGKKSPDRLGCLCVTEDGVTLPSEFDPLGDGADLDNDAKKAIRKNAGINPKGGTLADGIASVFDNGDPTGQDAPKPRLPARRGNVLQDELFLGPIKAASIWGEAKGHRNWNRVRDIMRADLLLLAETDEEAAGRGLSSMAKKFKVKPGDITDKIKPEKPHTTITDDFSSGLGNWIQDAGTWSIVAGELTKTGGGSNSIEFIRHATTMSSADHYALIELRHTSQAHGPVVRKIAGAAVTGYVAYLSPFSFLRKLVAGSATTLTLSFISPSIGDIYRLDINGSSLSVKVNDVEQHTGTDSAITGNLHAGLNQNKISATGSMDNFEASDGISGPTGQISGAIELNWVDGSGVNNQVSGPIQLNWTR